MDHAERVTRFTVGFAERATRFTVGFAPFTFG
jgi:hypothetical protein